MLPERRQAINSYGIRINYRTYDGGELTPLRSQHSGVVEQKGLWEIHYDPYDVSRVWLRDRRSEPARWITVFWKHLHRVGVPFGEMAWGHAREQVPGGTEKQIADAAAVLLTRAHDGPAADKDRSADGTGAVEVAGHQVRPPTRAHQAAADQWDTVPHRRAYRGGTWPNATGPGRRCTGCSAAGSGTAPGTASSSSSTPGPMRRA
ncbi:hypothetical protein GCM10009647_070750 [Streptomyces sanglieri]